MTGKKMKPSGTETRATGLLAKRSYKLILLAIAIVALLHQVSRLSGALSTKFMDDFVAYWAAGRLQLSGQNPYSYELSSEVQRAAGRQEKPHVMLYPPWAFSLLLLCGLADYASARLIWLLLNIGLLALLARLLWKTYGGPEKLLGLSWLIAFLFYPSLYLLRVGQMGVLVLFGIACFLRNQERGKDWMAGAALLLSALKPHLTYLFWIALALWIIERRRWAVLGGVTASLIVATVLPMAFNPRFVFQSEAVWENAQSPFFEMDTPTLGTILRKFFGEEKRWLQVLPMILGSVGFFVYWRKKREDWHWPTETPWLLAVSSWTALYSWVSDLILLLPALIETAVLALAFSKKQKQRWLVVFIGLNIFCLAVNLLGAIDFAYSWVAPILLLCYWRLHKAEPSSAKGKQANLLSKPNFS
jgi:hypothetical protein